MAEAQRDARPLRRRHTRRDFVRLTAGGAAGLALACAPAAPARSPDSAAPAAPAAGATQAPAVRRALDVVRRANLRGITFGAAIAKARGYFEEAGIDDQETVFASGAEQVQAIAAGQMDVGNSSNTAAFFNAIARGLRQPFVFDNVHLERGDRNYMVVVRPDLADTIKQIPDLRGRVNATSTPMRDGGSNFQAKKMFEAHGMQLEDVTWERLTFPDMLTAFGNRSIDVAWMIEPFITLGKNRGLLVPRLSLGDYDPGFQIAGIVYAERFILEQNDIGKRWGVAYVRGLHDYNDFVKGRKREIVAPILAEFTGLGPELVEQLGWPPLHPDGRLNLDSLMAAQRQLRDWGTIEQLLPVEQVADHQFVEYAIQQLGPYRG
jgi:NitT/TauT family transport system substrate-binding protein